MQYAPTMLVFYALAKVYGVKMKKPAKSPGETRVLRLIEKHPEMRQRDFACQLGVSFGGVNYVLKALVERGLVKAGNFGGSDRKGAYLYLLMSEGVAQKSSLATRILSRKLEECEALKAAIAELKRDTITALSGETSQP